MGTDDQGLGFKIGNAADAQVAPHVMDVIVKLGAEGRVLNVVDGPVETLFPVHCQAGPAGSQVGMIVRAEEQIKNTIFFGYNTKITAHAENPSTVSFVKNRKAFCRAAAESLAASGQNQQQMQS